MKKILLFLCFTFLLLIGCKKNKEELYIYNWSEYIPDELITEFEKETGISVIYSTYDSNEILYSKLKIQKGAGYDIVVPSTYYIEKMAKEGLLQELDHSKIDFSVFREDFLNQSYDSNNTYSIPYLWGPTLIMYNTKYVKTRPNSWNDLWISDYRGYVMLNNDVREVFQMALVSLGLDGNSVDEGDIKKAYDKLKLLVPSVRVFNSDSPKQPFLNNEVYIGLIWGGEAYMAMQSDRKKELEYSYPKEGAILWVDSMVIPKGAKNVDNAYKFISFISRPENAAKITETIGYATPNKYALSLLGESYVNNRLLNPTSDDLKNAVFQRDIGDAILIYDKYWERLKTGN